jgi:hypothetical protein
LYIEEENSALVGIEIILFCYLNPMMMLLFQMCLIEVKREKEFPLETMKEKFHLN